MKRFLIFVGVMMMVLGAFTIAGATSFQFQPNDHIGNPADLWNLAHGKYYKWGINLEIPAGETIVGASLFFDDIGNWNSDSNDLWVHLLNNRHHVGASEFSDSLSKPGDEFAGHGILLHHWMDMKAGKWVRRVWQGQDITYNFTTSELATLNTYAADGFIGFGFDPDCHFYNNGITLSVETAAAPEPATMLLLGTGLIGLAGFRKKFKKA